MLARAPSDLVGRLIYDFVVGGPLLSREEWRAAIARDEVTAEAELQREDGTAACECPKPQKASEVLLRVALLPLAA